MAIVAFPADSQFKNEFHLESKQKETHGCKPIDLFRREHNTSTTSLIEDHLKIVAYPNDTKSVRIRSREISLIGMRAKKWRYIGDFTAANDN